jgi:two-component system, NarL family, invasion response regulator UvrY
MADERVRVWVVDDQASFRMATAAAVATMDDFVMAGECGTGESAIELIRDCGAGIVLMDIHMPGMGGIEATRRIRATQPDLMVLLMSTYDVEDLPAGAADCGAAAYLHKEQLSPDLLTRLWQDRLTQKTSLVTARAIIAARSSPSHSCSSIPILASDQTGNAARHTHRSSP